VGDVKYQEEWKRKWSREKKEIQYSKNKDSPSTLITHQLDLAALVWTMMDFTYPYRVSYW
jgi:hypothetical protein